MKWKALCAGAIAVSTTNAVAWAEESSSDEGAVTLAAAYTADIMGVVDGGLAKRGRYLDNLDITLDADLDKAFGWSGWQAHVHLLNNAGGAPNDYAGTLQGVDNIEVSSYHGRVFEAWVEKAFSDTISLRGGLYDLNSEFYSNDSSGLLIAPAFGIGSEIAATGPNGPSIFPSTALALRLNINFARDYYARAAIINAEAGVLGDPDGVDTDFDNGALIIGEAGIEGDYKLAVGVWGYSEEHDDLDGAGHSHAQGVYVLGEAPLNDNEVRAATAFFRAGLSEGQTTPFRGGWQAGVLIEHVFEGRPDSAFSIGANAGALSEAYRDTQIADGVNIGDAEYAIELTYSDKLTDHISIQPDLQFIHRPGGDRDIEDALVAGLRVTLEL